MSFQQLHFRMMGVGAGKGEGGRGRGTESVGVMITTMQ